MPPTSEIVAAGIAAGIALAGIAGLLYARTAQLHGTSEARRSLAEFVSLVALACGALYAAGRLVGFDFRVAWQRTATGETGPAALVGAWALVTVAAACAYRLIAKVNRLMAEKNNDK